jgi:hypothetical protein
MIVWRLTNRTKALAMKKLFSSPHPAEMSHLETLLRAEGIGTELRNQRGYEIFPGAGFYPELWVLRDEDLPRARAILENSDILVSQTEETDPARLARSETQNRKAFYTSAVAGIVLEVTALILLFYPRNPPAEFEPLRPVQTHRREPPRAPFGFVFLFTGAICLWVAHDYWKTLPKRPKP